MRSMVEVAHTDPAPSTTLRAVPPPPLRRGGLSTESILYGP
jgi:hypothetical protein